MRENGVRQREVAMGTAAAEKEVLVSNEKRVGGFSLGLSNM